MNDELLITELAMGKFKLEIIQIDQIDVFIDMFSTRLWLFCYMG